MEETSDKLYYTIGEVAGKFKVNTSLIRFWEKEFDMLKPKKSTKGNRLYTTKDIERFAKVYDLVKEQGFTIQGAKDKLKAKSPSLDKKLEAIEKLQRIKTYLQDIQKRLEIPGA